VKSRTFLHLKNTSLIVLTKGSTIYFTSIDGGFKVNPSGNVEAKRIFEEMRTKTEEGFAYWKGKSKQGSKVPRFNQEDQTAIKKWASQDVKIGAIDVRSLKPTQQAMLALWLITKDLKVAEVVKPRMAFAYLTEKFTTIKGTADAFSKAFSRPSNKLRFAHNADGYYFLHGEGEKEVQTWLKNGAPLTDEASGGTEDESVDA
jgi:hypothetical protein